MILFIYSVTALVSILGGMVILSRSGASHGRAIALGLLCIGAAELGYLVFHLKDSLTAIRVASWFEFSTICCFIVSVISMEKSLSKKTLLILWARRSLIFCCALYAGMLSIHPNAYVSLHEQGMVVVGWLGRAHSILVLMGSILFIWIMENILKSSEGSSRRILKYPALGSISVGVSLCIASIYRLSTNTHTHDVITLCSLIFLVGVVFLIFFSIRFKLFEMDIFVSRYVVYHSITFIGMGSYLLITGVIIFWVQRLGVKAPLVVTGFLAFLALVALSILVLSPDAKARLRFFINTHFFSNKYDYRKEWGELSGYLAIAYKENQIIHVASQVILDSMYIRELSLWLKKAGGYTRVFSFPHASGGDTVMAGDHPLISYLRQKSSFLRRAPQNIGDRDWEGIVKGHAGFLDANKIELAVGMMVGTDLVGFIAVGKENPGTPYGQDDIDLLTAIASQAGSALSKAWFAERLAENMELDTYSRMSASMLHDLKNAAGHLSLVLQNAPKYMDQEEFRADMLDTVGQALARIDKVMGKLQAVPERDELHMETFTAGPFLQDLLTRLRSRLEGVRLVRDIDEGLCLTTDPDVLFKILENVIVNAAEAVEDDGCITVTARSDADVPFFMVQDNGVGMTDDFIRQRLFKPFQTTKKKGTGLGMWQVKNMAEQIGARIEVKGNEDRGVSVSLRLQGPKPQEPGAQGG
jgi:hypothetical protein